MSEVLEQEVVSVQPKTSVLTGANNDVPSGKWCAFHYSVLNGKEYINSITDYIFDDEATALKYIQDIAYYRKRNKI